MAKVVFKKLNDATARQIQAQGGTHKRKSETASKGGPTVLAVGDDAASFGRELTSVFGRNVAKARRENKRVTGALDRVPAKA